MMNVRGSVRGLQEGYFFWLRTMSPWAFVVSDRYVVCYNIHSQYGRYDVARRFSFPDFPKDVVFLKGPFLMMRTKQKKSGNTVSFFPYMGSRFYHSIPPLDSLEDKYFDNENTLLWDGLYDVEKISVMCTHPTDKEKETIQRWGMKFLSKVGFDEGIRLTMMQHRLFFN